MWEIASKNWLFSRENVFGADSGEMRCDTEWGFRNKTETEEKEQSLKIKSEASM